MSRRWAAVILAIAGSWLLAAGIAGAQGQPGGDMVASIHAGTCETPEPSGVIEFTAATPEAGGGDHAPVSFSARVDRPLAELLASPHVLLVERVDGDIATAFACGTIAADDEPQRVIVGLVTVETGALAGIAVITANDEGGTSMVVFLMTDGASPAGAMTEPGVPDDDGALDAPREPDDERDDTEGGV